MDPKRLALDAALELAEKTRIDELREQAAIRCLTSGMTPDEAYEHLNNNPPRDIILNVITTTREYLREQGG